MIVRGLVPVRCEMFRLYRRVRRRSVMTTRMRMVVGRFGVRVMVFLVWRVMILGVRVVWLVGVRVRMRV